MINTITIVQIMSMFGWSMGDIAAISTLAVKVITAYKNAPDSYRHISEEVRSLQILINKAAKYIGGTPLSNDDQQEGLEVLKGCQSILEDLDSLIRKYNSLASATTGQVFKKIKLGAEDIATLRSRLISNTVLLNGFIQRFLISLLLLWYYIMLIFLLSCEMQARLTAVLGLHDRGSRVSLNSITSFTGSINTKKAYKKFCKGLYQIGVTAEMISQNERAIHDIFKPQNAATTSSQIDGVTIENPSQLPVVVGGAENLPIPTEYKQSMFQPLVDLVGPLMLAATEAGDTERLASVLKYVRNINFQGNQKQTALHRAAYKGYTNIVRLLLENGASTEATDQFDNTPLHRAAWGPHIGVVELLLMEGASTEAMNQYNNTPLHRAMQHGHTGVVELLLEKGASTKAMDEKNNTPLHLAVLHNNTSIVELLLENDASTEAMDVHNNTPLHLAAQYGYTGVVELLLEKGAPAEAMNAHNNTPLHLAARYDRGGVVGLLLGKGASTGAVNTHNNTPLHLAVKYNHDGVVKQLLEKGAPIDVLNKDRETPLDLAKRPGYQIFGYTETMILLKNKAHPSQEAKL